jgi:hypothetical protein
MVFPHHQVNLDVTDAGPVIDDLRAFPYADPSGDRTAAVPYIAAFLPPSRMFQVPVKTHVSPVPAVVVVLCRPDPSIDRFVAHALYPLPGQSFGDQFRAPLFMFQQPLDTFFEFCVQHNPLGLFGMAPIRLALGVLTYIVSGRSAPPWHIALELTAYRAFYGHRSGRLFSFVAVPLRVMPEFDTFEQGRAVCF